MNKAFKVKYQDQLLLPVLILLMNAINLYIVYPNRLFSARFFRVLAEDTAVVLLCWLAMRRLILWLDQFYPFGKSTLNRIGIQLVTTLMLTCGLLLSLTWVIENYWYNRPVPNAVYTHHIWVYAFWILIHNGIYITMYMMQWSAYLEAQKHVVAELSPAAPIIEQDRRLVIKLGNKNIFVEVAAIRYCTTLGDFSKIYTRDNESFLIEKSLQDLVAILPSHAFFRANRQYIVHRDIITGIERIENGKVKLVLKPGRDLPPFIPVSRTKAPELKEWLRMAIA